MVDKPAAAPLVELVIPCLNEARVLEKSVTTIRGFLHQSFPFPARIVIADNGSEDGTSEIAEELAGKFDDVFSFSLSERGRGRARRKVWTRSSATSSPTPMSTSPRNWKPGKAVSRHLGRGL